MRNVKKFEIIRILFSSSGTVNPTAVLRVTIFLQIGVEVAPAGHHPENIENIPTQARHFRTSDPLETTIRGEAEMKEDKYSTLVLYTCVQIG